jgi:hypothetical protein
MLTLWEIFNTRDGRTVAIMNCAETRAIEYATAIGAAYDCSSAKSGFYVERKGFCTDYLLACYTNRLDAQRRADMENMGSDTYAFTVVEVRS